MDAVVQHAVGLIRVEGEQGDQAGVDNVAGKEG